MRSDRLSTHDPDRIARDDDDQPAGFDDREHRTIGSAAVVIEKDDGPTVLVWLAQPATTTLNKNCPTNTAACRVSPELLDHDNPPFGGHATAARSCAAKSQATATTSESMMSWSLVNSTRP